MIKKVILLSILYVFAFSVFALAYLPAGLAWQYLVVPAAKIQSLGVNARAFDGTVWDGRMHWSFRHLEGVLDWDLKAAELFSGSLPLDIKVISTAGRFSGTVDVGLSSHSISMDTLSLELKQLNPFLRQQRVKLDGELSAKNLGLTLDGKVVTGLNGRFSWTGGQISYPAGREMHDRAMPRFVGQVSTGENGDISLGIRDEDASFDTLRGAWTMQGNASWEVTRRVLDVAQEPWSINSTESDVVFKLKKPIPRELGGA